MKTMTFGTLPSDDDFSKAWDKTWKESGRNPDTAEYRIRNNKCGYDGSYNEPELYQLIRGEINKFENGDYDCDSPEMSTISIILQTLGFEWV